MAKPGSNGARQLRTRGVDLSRRKAIASMTDLEAAAAQELLEESLGLRCDGCGRRVTVGFKFTALDPRNPERPVLHLVACAREDCDFAEQARDGATVMQPIDAAWLDDAGKDARPAPHILERARRRAALLEAQKAQETS